MENLDDKNPRDGSGKTPLHEAAQNGHVELFEYIMDKVDEKEPKDYSGRTPVSCTPHQYYGSILGSHFRMKMRESRRHLSPVYF